MFTVPDAKKRKVRNKIIWVADLTGIRRTHRSRAPPAWLRRAVSECWWAAVATEGIVSCLGFAKILRWRSKYIVCHRFRGRERTECSWYSVWKNLVPFWLVGVVSSRTSVSLLEKISQKEVYMESCKDTMLPLFRGTVPISSSCVHLYCIKKLVGFLAPELCPRWGGRSYTPMLRLTQLGFSQISKSTRAVTFRINFGWMSHHKSKHQ